MASYYSTTYAPKSQSSSGSRRPSQSAIAASVSNIMYKNAVYYPSWRCYRGETPATLNFSCISHVFYAFAHVAKDGSVFFADDWELTPGGCIGSLMGLRQIHPHIKIILSIGGANGSQHFAHVANHAATRDNFGRSARGLLDASGFDGIDIDWEHPSDAAQGHNFLSLLAAIRLHLPEEQYILTAALPAGRWALQHIDLHRTRHYLNFINLMAYDFTGPWSRKAGHHAQLYQAHRDEPSGAAAVDYIKSTGFPSSKIVLGIPCYGRSFLGASKPGQKFDGGGGEEGTFDFKMLPRPNTDEVINTSVVAAFCVGSDGGFVSYDNPDTVRAKAEYCRNKRLGGLFYWTGASDVPRGSRSLIATGFKALHGQELW